VDPSQLDGVSVIVGALAAGAGDGLKDVAKGAVTGAAYSVGQGLQAARDKLAGLLKSRFHDNEDAAADLNVYLRRPTPENAEPLAGHILEAGLDHDQQILAAARQLLAAAGPTAIGPGSIAAGSISQINKDAGTGFIGGQHVHHHEASTPSPAADWELFHIRGWCSSSATSGPGPRMMSYSTHRVRSGSILPEACPRGGRGRVASCSQSAACRPGIPGWWCGGRTPPANRRTSPGNDHCRDDQPGPQARGAAAPSPPSAARPVARSACGRCSPQLRPAQSVSRRLLPRRGGLWTQLTAREPAQSRPLVISTTGGSEPVGVEQGQVQRALACQAVIGRDLAQGRCELEPMTGQPNNDGDAGRAR